MTQTDDRDDDARPAGRRLAGMIATAAVVLAVLVAGVATMLSGDKDPPRRVQELTVVAIVPPPPPPPPPPEQPPPEQKVVEQTPVRDEIIEEKPVDIPQETPDTHDEPAPGPPALDAAGKGPGELLGRPGGKGFIGGGGGGGGGSRWGWYASIVQSQIENALRANERTRHAVLQIQVRMWADGFGRVSRVQLVSTTGDPSLDAVIRDEILGRLTLREPPPKEMPMPIITRVTARKPG